MRLVLMTAVKHDRVHAWLHLWLVLMAAVKHDRVHAWLHMRLVLMAAVKHHRVLSSLLLPPCLSISDGRTREAVGRLRTDTLGLCSNRACLAARGSVV